MDQIWLYLKDTLSENEFFQGGMLVTVISALLYQMKAVPVTIWHFIYRHIVYQITIDNRDNMYLYVTKYFEQHFQHKQRRSQIYSYWCEYSDKTSQVKINSKNIEISNPKYRKNQKEDYNNFYATGLTENKPSKVDGEYNFLVDHKEDSFIIWHKFVPIIVHKDQERLESARDTDNMMFDSYLFTSFFGKTIILDFIRKISNSRNSEIQSRKETSSIIYKPRWDDWEKTDTIDFEPKVVLEDGILERIESDLNEFIQEEEWYKQRGLRYKRGYLFYGKPGNGKSSLSAYLSKKFNKDIYELPINDNNIKEKELTDLFLGIPKNQIILLEDIDCLISDRKTQKKKGINFSSILNMLDGVGSSRGNIIIATTNYIENLDPALIRTGRFDVKVEIKNPSQKQAKKYYESFFETTIDIEANDNKLDISMSDLQEIFKLNKKDHQKALELMQDNF